MASEPETPRASATPASRSLPLSLHRPIELVLGGVLAIVPLLGSVSGAFPAPAGGVIVSMVLGAVVLTLGLAGSRESEGVSASAHAVADRIVVGALLVAGIAFVIAGHGATGIFLVLIGIAQAILTFATRYTRDEPGGDRRNEPS